VRVRQLADTMICDYLRYLEPASMLDCASVIYPGLLNAVGMRPRLMVGSGLTTT